MLDRSRELERLISRDRPSPVWDGLERRLVDRMRPSMHVWIGEVLEDSGPDFSVCADFRLKP